MKSRPVVPRSAASDDVHQAIDYYLGEGSVRAALGFISALEAAYRHIGRAPASGSPRYAHELDIPGLRSWPLRRYPYIVFYVEGAEKIDVWRVLHDERDIPGTLRS